MNPSPRDDTGEFELPVDETPPVYTRVEPRYFGLTPHLLAGGLAVGLLLGAVVLLATANLAVGLLLLVAGLFLGALFAEQARRRRSSSVDRATARATDRSLAAMGFARAVVEVWVGAGSRAARVRVESQKLSRERSRVQFELGGAVHAGDEARVEELQLRMLELDAEIERRAQDAQAAIDEARRRTTVERQAVSATQVRRPSA